MHGLRRVRDGCESESWSAVQQSTVPGRREREIDEEGAQALPHTVNRSYTTTIAQMGGKGCVCGKTDVFCVRFDICW